MKNVLIAGSTGMIGSLILEECLSLSEVSSVTIINRKPSGISDPKLTQVISADFYDCSNIAEIFENIDLAFFCIGVYTGQVSDEKFKEITVDYAVSFGKTLKEQSPNATLCLLSGQGADRSEKSRVSFAKYKGMAENQLIDMDFQEFYSFRPAYIYPVSPRKEPNFMYKAMRAMYPLFKLLGSKYSIKSTELASAMVKIGLNGAEKQLLENRDILKHIK